jgi:hypothetical protein
MSNEIIGLGLVNIIGTVLVAGFVQAQSTQISERLGTLEGVRIERVAHAVETAVRANWGNVLGSLPTTIDIANLSAAGQPGAQVPLQSLLGNSYVATVVAGPVPSSVRILVTQTGEAMDGAALNATVNAMEGMGIRVENQGGSLIAWGYGAPREQAIAVPSGVAAPGTPAAQIYLTARMALPEWLCRSPMPGLPECQTMETDIDMGGHAILNAGEVTAASATISNSIEAARINARTITAPVAVIPTVISGQ